MRDHVAKKLENLNELAGPNLFLSPYLILSFRLIIRSRRSTRATRTAELRSFSSGAQLQRDSPRRARTHASSNYRHSEFSLKQSRVKKSLLSGKLVLRPAVFLNQRIRRWSLRRLETSICEHSRASAVNFLRALSRRITRLARLVAICSVICERYEPSIGNFG